MRAIHRKVLRDVWAQRRQHAALALAVAAGVAAFILPFGLTRNIQTSYDTTYDRLGFEDFEIAMRGAPPSVVDRVRSVHGVAAAEGRLVQDIMVELNPDTSLKVFGRFVSLPAPRHPSVDDVVVEAGRYLSSPSAREVMLESDFAHFHNLHPGDILTADVGPQRVRLRVVGIVQSPEYLESVRSKQYPAPSPDTFGAIFISADVLASIVGKNGVINQIVARTDGTQPLADVMRDARRWLEAYGPEDPVPRADQPSYKLLSVTLKSIAKFAQMFPILFLSVTALADYALMMRVVAAQRAIIGMLRSLGYSRRAVIAHYLAGAAIIGLIGSILGGAIGTQLAAWFTRYYSAIFTVPFLTLLSPTVPMALGALGGTVACVLGALAPAGAASRLEPAEALRPAAPTAGRVVALDRSMGAVRRLPLFWRLPFLNLFRNPRRTWTTALGVAAALALIVVANGFRETIANHIDSYFRDLFAFDLSVQLDASGDEGDVARVRNIEGVVWAEPTLAVPSDIRHGGVVESVAVSGIPAGSRLFHFETEGGRRIAPSQSGIVLSSVMSHLLGVGPGGVVMTSLPALTVDSPRRWRAVRVDGTAFVPAGYTAYVSLDEGRRLYGDDLGFAPGAVSGIAVVTRPAEQSAVASRLRELDHVAAVQSSDELRREIAVMMAVYNTFFMAMTVVGLALGFAMVYNMVSANVSERESEIATMRTLGIRRTAISAAIILENLFAAVAGVAVGLPAGRYLVDVFTAASQMDIMPIRAFVSAGTLGVAVSLVLAAAVVSLFPALLAAGRIDLAQATRQGAS